MHYSQRPVHFMLQEQEFCEVSNDSPTDPACWLARIKRVNKDSYLVSKAPPECYCLRPPLL